MKIKGYSLLKDGKKDKYGNGTEVYIKGTSFSNFSDNLTKEIIDSVKTKVEQDALKFIVYKMMRTSVENGGYGIINQDKEKSNHSISKWRGVVNKGTKGISISLINSAVNRTNEFPYVSTLYGDEPNGGLLKAGYGYGRASYGARDTVGMDEKKVKEMKSKIVDEVKKSIYDALKERK